MKKCSSGKAHSISLATVCLIFCGAVVSTVALFGCGTKNNDTVGSRRGSEDVRTQQLIRSTTDLRRILLPGMKTNEIAAVFGEPRWIEDLGKARQIWHYSLPAFPADDDMKGTYVAGVAVGITNGHLANWGCFYVGSADTSRKQDVLAVDKRLGGSSTLQFFIVHNDPSGDLRFIDNERFPKLGFIGRTPSLTVRRLKEVTLEERVLSEGHNRTNWSFGIFLTEEDAAKLKAITETNISLKVLITVDNEPISAPKIRAPLETGSFIIDCEDRSLMESLKKQLTAMEQQGR